MARLNSERRNGTVQRGEVEENMSFLDLTQNELAYENYMENKQATSCDQCAHSCVCWKVGTDEACWCTDFKSVSMKLKELLPLIEGWIMVKAYLGEREVSVGDNQERTIKSVRPDKAFPGLDSIAIELEEHYET